MRKETKQSEAEKKREEKTKQENIRRKENRKIKNKQREIEKTISIGRGNKSTDEKGVRRGSQETER